MDAECRWDWRHGRCEPFCDCQFQLQWGDYHLGRACRLRPQGSEPLFCDVAPQTKYADPVKSTLQRTNAITYKTRTSLALWKNRIQTETCSDLPTECRDGEDYRRSLKDNILCRHVPSPCEGNDEDEEHDVSFFVSPLANDAEAETASNDNTTLPPEGASRTLGLNE